MGIDRGKRIKIKNQKKPSEHRAMKASRKEILQGRRVHEEAVDDSRSLLSTSKRSGS